MNRNKNIQLGILVLFLAIALGAFGAHGIKNLVGPDQVASYNTGIRYQFYHGFAILIAVWLSEQWLNPVWCKRAIWCFGLGIILFSGSIYLLSLREVFGIEHWKFLGPMTPIGGLFFLLGWALLFIGTFGKSRELRATSNEP